MECSEQQSVVLAQTTAGCVRTGRAEPLILPLSHAVHDAGTSSACRPAIVNAGPDRHGSLRESRSPRRNGKERRIEVVLKPSCKRTHVRVTHTTGPVVELQGDTKTLHLGALPNHIRPVRCSEDAAIPFHKKRRDQRLALRAHFPLDDFWIGTRGMQAHDHSVANRLRPTLSG